jgi:hypothetical protein
VVLFAANDGLNLDLDRLPVGRLRKGASHAIFLTGSECGARAACPLMETYYIDFEDFLWCSCRRRPRISHDESKIRRLVVIEPIS